jgi:hypothetical protein
MRLTATILLFSLLIWGCQSAPDGGVIVTKTVENGEPVITFTQSSWKEKLTRGYMQFEAGKVIIKGEPPYRRILLHDMRMVLRNAQDEERLRVAAGRLFLMPEMDHVELSGNVLLTTHSGIELEADSLEFHVAEKLLEGTGNVRLISDKYILEGSAIVGNLTLSAYEVMGLKGVINLEAADSSQADTVR